MRRVIHTLRPAFFFAVGATLSACSATTYGSAVPSGNPAAHVHRATTTTGELLYIGAQNYIETYAYPAGTAAAGIKTAFNVIALCSDAHGNVFALGTTTKNGATIGAVYEYTHGGTQVIETLALPARQIPAACSSDTSTGNLAVTSYNGHNFTPQVNVYANAGGTPQVYMSSALSAAPQPAYDDAGDLYVTSGGNSGAYLPAGSTALITITVNVILGNVAHAQWDGKYFALQSFTVARHQGEHTLERVYRIGISGSTGTLEGSTHFTGWYSKDAGFSWIAGDTMVATPGKYVAIWTYPGGGKSINVIHPAKKGRAVTVSAPGS
jgi:predicted small integral membrane protein